MNTPIIAPPVGYSPDYKAAPAGLKLPSAVPSLEPQGQSARSSLATCSDARSLAVELAKLIKKQDDECEYREVPTERLEALLEKFFTERVLAHPNTEVRHARANDGDATSVPHTNENP